MPEPRFPKRQQGLYPERISSGPDRRNTLSGLLRYGTGHWLPERRQQRRFCSSVNRLEHRLAMLGPEQLREEAERIRDQARCQTGKTALAAETFGLVREQAKRILGLRHYDVQIAGGWIILTGAVAEMATGEGKTLAATLPASYAALSGVPVHIITANDYLAQRDAELMAPLYQAMGIEVGAIQPAMSGPERKKIYNRDIVYCSNKEIVFDYLKDRLILGKKAPQRINLPLRRFFGDTAWLEELRLRGLHFAIVDEADCIFIDEARTPLILSRTGDCGLPVEVYDSLLSHGRKLQQGFDFTLDPATKSAALTDRGRQRIRSFGAEDATLAPCRDIAQFLFEKALAALYLYENGREYIVTASPKSRVAIVDEHTGRSMPGRSWEMGLHQLIEVKEGCPVTGQPETVARLNYQTFFNRYHHLAGMTGTAREVRRELWDTYRLRVRTVPTNLPEQSSSSGVQLFPTIRGKNEAIVKRVGQLHRAQRAVLLGTSSVTASETIASLLKESGFQYTLLNARQDRREAEIIARAGYPGQITIATNMAGRGTDIALQPGTAERGGLHVLATECAHPRRIDRQLFGRCGRQGDPGSYEALFSLEDTLFQSTHLGYGTRSLLYLIKLLKIQKGFLVLGAIRLTQASIERHYFSLRRRLEKAEKKWEKALSFSSHKE